MEPKRLLAIVALLLLSGCVSAVKEREVFSAIRGLGFTEADARCLAARAGRSLSIRQLRSLQGAAAALDQPVKEMTVGQVVDAVRNNVDGATLGIIVRLAVDCARARVQEKKS